jgi:hypothetical protein
VGCYRSSKLAFAVPRASWREIFSWKRGLGKKRRKSPDHARRARGRFPFRECRTFIRFRGPLALDGSYGSALRFEPDLELGIELVQAGFHPTGDVGPTPILERGDGDSQFEFDRILGLKVTTAVAAHDF